MIGEKIKAEREKRGWSQSDLAEKSGVGRSMIALIETGRAKPSVGTTKKLADALGISALELLEALLSEEAPHAN